MKKSVILCVDDEPIVLKGLETQLGRSFGKDYIIEFAESGEEALEIIEEIQGQDFDFPLLISDQIMPGLKGNELLKKAHSLSEVTLKILLTGQADAAAVGDALNNAKLYRYMSKPWEADDLIITVKEALKSFSNQVLIEEQNKKLREYNDELELKVEKRTKEIQEAHKSIKDSIKYAKRIQKAMLPPIDILSDSFADHFILYEPKDIVSGDFYWMNKIENNLIITAADCTGHGVPGAFMSMMGISFLNEMVMQGKLTQPHEILNKLRIKIINSLNPSGQKEMKDGMDMALCKFNLNTLELEFAGAYNPLLIYRKGEEDQPIRLAANRMPVGIHVRDTTGFTKHSFQLKKGDTVYMFSDGYYDQFGGHGEKKYMKSRFKKYLSSIQHLSLSEQQNALIQEFTAWKGREIQVDDILVIGLRV